MLGKVVFDFTALGFWPSYSSFLFLHLLPAVFVSFHNLAPLPSAPLCFNCNASFATLWLFGAPEGAQQ